MFRKIMQWLIYSSANPQAFSLTLKGLVPFLVLLGIGGGMESDINSIIDLASTSLVALGTLVSGVIALYGALRKVYFTVRG